MEGHVQIDPNSPGDICTLDQSENFNDVGWASFPEINEEEHVKRVS